MLLSRRTPKRISLSMDYVIQGVKKRMYLAASSLSVAANHIWFRSKVIKI